MDVQYQVTHEMMAESILSLSWSFPKSIRHHLDWHDQGHLAALCLGLVVVEQAGRLSGKVHNLMVCQSMKSPLTATVTTWIVTFPHLPPLWVLPFLS